VGLIAILAFATAHAASDTASAKKALRWKLRAGQEFRVHSVQSSDGTITGDAGQEHEKVESVADELCRVEAVDSRGTADLTMTIERVRLRTRSPRGNVDIDTNERTEKLPMDIALTAELAKKIISEMKVRFSVDNRGRIVAVKINEEAVRVWASIVPGWSDRFSEKEITKTLRQVLPVFPESPLAVGDTWNDTLEFSRPHGTGFQKVYVKYRYAGPTAHNNRTVDKIVTEATLDWGDEKLPHGVTVKVVSQENPGTIYFDNQTGRLVEIENTQRRAIEYRREGRTIREQVSATSRIEIVPCPSQ